MTDMVDHPPHYKKYSIECIEITEHLSFCLGNVVKYIYRAGEKGDAIEDIKKALWYLNRAEFNNEDFSKYPLVVHRINLLLRDMNSHHDDEMIAFRDELGLNRDVAWYRSEKINESLKKNLHCQNNADMSRVDYAKNNLATLMMIVKAQILDGLVENEGRSSLPRGRRRCDAALELLENLSKNFE